MLLLNVELSQKKINRIDVEDKDELIELSRGAKQHMLNARSRTGSKCRRK
jgi:hypothetical protein